MKKMFIMICLLVATITFAKFSIQATVEPVLVQKGPSKNWCPVSGLKISEHYKTSYISKLKINGTPRQYSSLHALIIDMQEYGIDMEDIKVVDATSQKYINVQKAFFVLDETNEPTAFDTKANALLHVKKYKGEVVDFQTALHVAQKNLKSYLSLMKKRYQKKAYPMGQKVFKKKCNQEIDLTGFIEINELKASLVSECKNLSEEHLQAAALYLWDVKRKGDLGEIEGRVEVNEDEKCPVCGMFTYKYPRWAAQIFYKHGDHEHHLSFDGVKDLMKFYFNPSKWGEYKELTQKNITKILVTDYYSQKAIDARDAYFVIRSNIYGPMGHELIPFTNQSDALTFKTDHKGKLILRFNDILEEEVYKLDSSE